MKILFLLLLEGGWTSLGAIEAPLQATGAAPAAETAAPNAQRIAEWPLIWDAPHYTYIHYLPSVCTEVTLKIGEQYRRTRVILDTGTPYEFIVSSNDEATLHMRNQRVSLAVVMGQGEEAPIKPDFTDVMMHLEHPMVGQAFLGKYCATFDFEKNVLWLESPRAQGDIRREKGTWVVPFRGPQKPWNIWIPATINGVKAEYHVDTGNSFTWLHNQIASDGGMEMVKGDGTYGVGKLAKAVIGDEDALGFFPYVRVCPPTGQHAKFGKTCFGDLGLSFLRQFVVTIDMVNHLLYFKPWRKPRTDFRLPALGLTCQPSEHPLGLNIIGVAKEGVAALAGIQTGDCLLTLANVPMREPYVLSMQLATYHQVGEPVELEFQRGGITKAVTATLAAEALPAK